MLQGFKRWSSDFDDMVDCNDAEFSVGAIGCWCWWLRRAGVGRVQMAGEAVQNANLALNMSEASGAAPQGIGTRRRMRDRPAQREFGKRRPTPVWWRRGGRVDSGARIERKGK